MVVLKQLTKIVVKVKIPIESIKIKRANRIYKYGCIIIKCTKTQSLQN